MKSDETGETNVCFRPKADIAPDHVDTLSAPRIGPSSLPASGYLRRGFALPNDGLASRTFAGGGCGGLRSATKLGRSSTTGVSPSSLVPMALSSRVHAVDRVGMGLHHQRQAFLVLLGAERLQDADKPIRRIAGAGGDHDAHAIGLIFVALVEAAGVERLAGLDDLFSEKAGDAAACRPSSRRRRPPPTCASRSAARGDGASARHGRSRAPARRRARIRCARVRTGRAK